ncbi:NACHT and WD40 repeat domain-containing protein [Nonomuraea sp. NPDC002799]
MPGTWRRHIRNAMVAIMGMSLLALAYWTFNSGLAENDARASVISCFIGLAALGVTVADYLRGGEERPLRPEELADDLASTIKGQWLDEARARGLSDTGVLPLTWSATDRQVSDTSVVLSGPPRTGRVLRLRLTGRITGGFDEATEQLAADYGRLASGRLVILGEPGAGKSVLAILLTLGLLGKTRVAGTPVPVLLAASSWDPVSEPMDEWIVRALAASYYNGRPQIPQLLSDRGLLVPVIDGLDEIQESVRRSAVRAISTAIGRERPVIVTCRSVEYEDVITGGVPVLRKAPVVEVAPLAAPDVVAYLSEVPWPDGTDWSTVFTHLHDDPEGPVATSLSTPLMVSLARRTYQRCGGDPGELLDDARFGSRHAVEDYLIDRMIDAAYTTPTAKWDAHKARGWLVFLAKYLHQHRERDLAWWLLSQRLLSPWVASGIGITAGFILLMIMFATLGTPDPDTGTTTGGVLDMLGGNVTVCVFYAVLAMVAWYIGAGRAPGKLSFALTGSLVRLRRGFAAGAALAAILLVPTAIGVGIVSLAGPWPPEPAVIERYWHFLALMVSLACVIGLAMAVHSWLEAPPTRSAQASPHAFLRQDRVSSPVGAVAAGTVLSLASLPCLAAGVAVAGVLMRLGMGWSGEPTASDVIDASFGIAGYRSLLPLSTTLLIGLGFGLLIMLTRAWPRFVIARAVLAARGQLPWRLLGFLAHARKEELLRQSGGTYQFRHYRVQEWLANQQLPVSASSAIKAKRRRRSLVAAATVTGLLAWNTLIGNLPDDQSQATFLTDGYPIFSTDGKTVAFADGRGRVNIWQWNIQRHVHTLASNPGQPLSFSADGRLLMVDSADPAGSTVQIWDVGTGKLLRQVIKTFDDYTSFTPDSSAFTLYRRNAPLQLVDIRTGSLRALPATVSALRSDVTDVTFSPDSRTLSTVSGSGSAVWIWDAGELRPLWKLRTNDVSSTWYSPDGRTLVTYPLEAPGRVTLWDVGSGKQLDWLNSSPSRPISEASFSSDNRTLAVISATGGTIWMWDLAHKRTPQRLTIAGDTLYNASSAQFSPENRFAVVVIDPPGDSSEDDDTACIWDTATRQSCVPLRIHGNILRGIRAVAFSPDGRIFAAAVDETVWLWDTVTVQPRRQLVGHTGPVSEIQFSSDGRTMATEADDGTVRVWNTATPSREYSNAIPPS